MGNNIQHFSIGVKSIVIVLVLAILATLIPIRIFTTNAYAEDSSITLTEPDFTLFSEYPKKTEGELDPGGRSFSDKSIEYEQLALEKLGQPLTVEKVAPYKRSNVSYQKTDLPNAFTRDYALKNGNYTRLVFGSPVNYKIGEGVWKKIDLTLHEEDERLVTVDAPYMLSFVTSSKENTSLIDLDYNGFSISLTPLNTSAEPSAARYVVASHTYDELLTENPCERGTVFYEDIFSETELSPTSSLEYILEPYSIKENIVVCDGGHESYTYPFLFTINNCSAEMGDGRITIHDDFGNTVFTLTASTMKDAKGACSEAVSLSYRIIETGLLVTVSADSDWINMEEREFPVRIDPTIVVVCSDNEIPYDAVYVDGNTRGYGLEIGNGVKTHLKFKSGFLTGLPAGASVGAASFTVGSYLMPVISYDSFVRAEKITDNWDLFNVYLGNTTPSVPASYAGLTDSARIQTVGSLPSYVSFSLDITSVIQDYIKGTGYGFTLSTEAPSGTFSGHYAVSMTAVQITFSENPGLNEFQSMHSVSIDGSGTAYIKDINGDLVFVHPGISTKGEKLPVSVDLVYSSSFKGSLTDLYYGMGWRPSILQTMESVTVTDINGSTHTYYVHTDGTGAKSYYTNSNGPIYKCEEYPIYEYNASTRTLDYHNGSKALFNSLGYLVEYENEYGDSYLIGYSSTTPKITYVLDGNNVQLSFVYSQSKLIRIENDDCSDRAVCFMHNGSNLTKISSTMGENTNIVYSSAGTFSRFGYRKTLNETVDRVYVSFSYCQPWSNGEYATANVAKYELQNDSTYSLCDCVSLLYSDHTEYHYHYGNTSPPCYKEYIHFDRNGRTVAVFDSLGNVSGSNYEGGDIDVMNRISGQTSAVMTNGNLVKDFTALSSSWSFFPVIGSGSLVSLTTAGHFDGNKYGDTCFKLSQNTSNDPLAEVYASYPVPSAIIGKTYTLTADIDTSELNGLGDVVFGIKFDFFGMPNVKIVSPLKSYSDNKSIQFTVEIPLYASAGSVCILIGVKNLSGNLYFDLVSLTEGALAKPTNQISDSSFFYGTTAWTANGFFNPTVSTNDLIRNVVIPGSINSQRSLSQVLPSSVSDGGYLVVSGFGKGKAVSSGKFGIRIHFNSSSSHDSELLFSTATKEWQFLSIIIKIEEFSSDVTISLVNDYNYTDVCFGGLTAEYIDSFGDYSDRSQYIYDSFGRIRFERSFSGAKTEYVYENTLPDRILAVYHTDYAGNKTSTYYSYTPNYSAQVNRIDESFAPSGNSSLSVDTYDLYSYNLHGKLVSSDKISGNSYISRKVYDYTSNGRFLRRETDLYGNDITYSYSDSTGDLLSVTDTNGSTTCFTYDSYGRMIGETKESASFGIAYDQHSTCISHNGFNYSFSTNNAGNMTSFSILDANDNIIRTVADYTYGGRFGQTSEIHYGNSQAAYYGYDSLGRLTFVAYDSNANITTATFAWYYDDNGNVIKLIDRSDTSNVITKQFSYDQTGNLKYVLSSDGNKILYQHEMEESVKVEKESFTTALTSREYNSRTEIDASSRTATKEGITGIKTLMFDDYGRLSAFTHSNSSSSSDKSYSYIVMDKNTVYNNGAYRLVNETSLVATETCSLESVPTIEYEYYDNGKIKSISENNSLTIQYEYDPLGQLIREDNKKLNNGNGYTIKYNYDNGGNLLAKMIFSYSPSIATASLYGTATIISFPIYSCDATDKDLLSTYLGGTYYSYDSVGNPLTYFGRISYAMTWTRGNKLASVTPNGSNYAQSYLYDADGLRTRKTLVSNSNISKQVNYFWVGNTLRSEWAEDGSYEIVFDYDSAGRICGFAYSQNGGTPAYYRYIRNIQGDVTHIINYAGSVVATYTYDTWGSLISIKNGSGFDITNNTTSIGYINPIRYRGYYYDNETGFYYLQSRYYDPVTGRFLNADSQLNIEDGILGTNLYCYCGNDPVNYSDPTGKIPFFLVTAAIGAVAGAIVGGIIAAASGKNVWAGIGIGAAAGGLIGLGAGAAAGAALAGSFFATTSAVMAGCNTLAATIASGGLSSGAALFTNNIVNAINELSTSTQEVSCSMQRVVEKGKDGEALSGLVKNHAHIESISGTAAYRVPDGLDAGLKILSEVKNYSGVLSYTKQIKDFVLWAEKYDYTVFLYTNATLSGPLQRVVDSGIIKIIPLG